MQTYHHIQWAPDILGAGFESATVTQPDDYTGAVRCTVVRKLSADPGRKAILYIHGYSDYFFQSEMADMFVDHGYDFYAVDLRRYGRSLLPGQKLFEVRDLHEYFADIDAALSVISPPTDEIILLGHSTGGLIASLYMSENPPSAIRALILDSPFLAWNLPAILRAAAIPVLSFLGSFLPGIHVHQKADPGYADSLSAAHGGEWHYRSDWKPDVMPDPDLGWIRAIEHAQRQLRHRSISVPVLLMHSARSVRMGQSKEDYASGDAILDVDLISRYGRMLGPDVTEVAFEGGLHNLVLSREDVRRQVYATMLGWLKEHIP